MRLCMTIHLLATTLLVKPHSCTQDDFRYWNMSSIAAENVATAQINQLYK